MRFKHAHLQLSVNVINVYMVQNMDKIVVRDRHFINQNKLRVKRLETREGTFEKL